jgi:hypothetical protein
MCVCVCVCVSPHLHMALMKADLHSLLRLLEVQPEADFSMPSLLACRWAISQIHGQEPFWKPVASSGKTVIQRCWLNYLIQGLSQEGTSVRFPISGWCGGEMTMKKKRFRKMLRPIRHPPKYLTIMLSEYSYCHKYSLNLNNSFSMLIAYSWERSLLFRKV